jgi:hypothetical protein
MQAAGFALLAFASDQHRCNARVFIREHAASAMIKAAKGGGHVLQASRI